MLFGSSESILQSPSPPITQRNRPWFGALFTWFRDGFPPPPLGQGWQLNSVVSTKQLECVLRAPGKREITNNNNK